MMLKMFYMREFVRWTKCIWWAIENHYLHVYKFFEFVVNEFLQSEITQKLSSVQKIICITAIADEKIRSLFRVSGLLFSPNSACCWN